MPKSARKSDINRDKETQVSNISNNASIADEASKINPLHLPNEEEFPPLPVTPSKPPPQKKPALTRLQDPDYTRIPENNVKAVVEPINARRDALEKIISGIHTDLKATNEKITIIESRVENKTRIRS